MNFMTTQTCTIVVSADGARCGKPAVTSFQARGGQTFSECAEHNMSVKSSSGSIPQPRHEARHPKTRTTAPYVLVQEIQIIGDDYSLSMPNRIRRIVGYAHSMSDAVQRRAARLNAEIVPVQR